MRATLAMLILCAATGSVRAQCTGDTTLVLSCLARGGSKALNVCLVDANQTISYAYGPPSGPAELSLLRPVAEIEHHPWPGIGRSIWETTVFRNAGYAYEVFTSVDRMDEDQPVTGGVLLSRGGKEIARIECDAGTVEMGLWAVTDAKEALGLCWDQSAESWIACSQ